MLEDGVLINTFERRSAMYLEYFDTTADDFREQSHWVERLGKAVVRLFSNNGRANFHSAETDKIINLAAFESPRCPFSISLSDKTGNQRR
jgi:hypothetical protein